jgi:hypothetical protein
VTQNNRTHSDVPEQISPGDFPVGSDESRAAARAVVEGIGGVPPTLVVTFVKANLIQNPDGQLKHGSPILARLRGQRPNESRDAFIERTLDAQPVTGTPSPLVLLSADEEVVSTKDAETKI